MFLHCGTSSVSTLTHRPVFVDRQRHLRCNPPSDGRGRNAAVEYFKSARDAFGEVNDGRSPDDLYAMVSDVTRMGE